MKVSGSKYIFLVLYVDDIFLATNDINLLVEIKQLLFSHFDIKDLGEASYVLAIQILRDKPSGIMRLSQQMYIERILKRFNMQSCSFGKRPIVKGNKFSKGQCPHNDIERDKMKSIPYSSVVGSLMYAQVCTHLDIAFVVGVLGRYLSDLGQSHWKAAKKFLRYLQGTKDFMLTYQRTDTLEVVDFSDFDYACLQHFSQLSFMQPLHFYDIISLDYRELSRELGNSFCFINKFDFGIVSVWKHFNFLARSQLHGFILGKSMYQTTNLKIIVNTSHQELDLHGSGYCL